jgi:AcrR family transcriptional regulator
VSALYDAYLRKRPKQSRSRSVVEAILQAAADTISRGSTEDVVTVHEIAERAGVGVGSLYDYFGDRRSVLASLAAKVTQDNLEKLEKQLAASRHLPLGDAIGELIDHLYATYIHEQRIPRAVLRVAHQIGLMPTLAESQAMFALTLAKELRARGDVTVKDVELTAFAMTNMTMGMIHSRIWQDTPPFPDPVVRDEMVRIWTTYLAS